MGSSWNGLDELVMARDEQVEKSEQEKRKEICKKCEEYGGWVCKKCGCVIPIKTIFKASKCPLNKW